MKKKWMQFALLLPILSSGCIAVRDSVQSVPPDLGAIILKKISWQTNTIQEAVADIATQCARNYPDRPIRFEVRLGGGREKNKWTEAGPNYFVFIPEDENANQTSRISFRARDITLVETLRFMSQIAFLDWWTEGHTVVFGHGNPVFQAPMRRYDANANDLLIQVLHHLLSDADARRDLSSYLFDPESDEKSPLRRVLLQTTTFPKAFKLEVPEPSVVMTDDFSNRQIGDLTISVHRFLDRGLKSKQVVLFITGPNISGGGWFTYIATRDRNKWNLKYRGCNDP